MNSRNEGGWRRAAIRLSAVISLAGCGGGSPPSAPPPAETLSAAAVAGKALFSDATLSASGRQSCATCHIPARAFTADPATDHDLPVPLGGVNMDQAGFRNAPSLAPIDQAPLSATPPLPADVPADAEYACYDLGLCGPFAPAAFDVNARPMLAATTSLCGLFKVPILRNVAITAPYFHNGVFSTLRQVVEWYVTRDINNNATNNPNPVAAGPGGNPYQAVGTFYTAANGTPNLYEYNDLPAAYNLPTQCQDAAATGVPAYSRGYTP